MQPKVPTKITTKTAELRNWGSYHAVASMKMPYSKAICCTEIAWPDSRAWEFPKVVQPAAIAWRRLLATTASTFFHMHIFLQAKARCIHDSCACIYKYTHTDVQTHGKHIQKESKLIRFVQARSKLTQCCLLCSNFLSKVHKQLQLQRMQS